jgi:acetyl-CoA decarbonylase/synthase complex subunit gamma
LVLYIVAVISGTLLSPLLLPILPGRMFSVKGAVAGGLVSLIGAVYLWSSGKAAPLDVAAAVVVMTAVSAFYAMNFTGSTPYTSLSGVRREMKFTLPVLAVMIVSGVAMLVYGVLS